MQPESSISAVLTDVDGTLVTKDTGTLQRYIDELSVTGLTSNPTIFEQAIKKSSAYDGAIGARARQGKSGEDVFFDLAIEDLTQAADLFRAIHERTGGVDGWVSLEVSPLLAHDAAGTLAAAKSLFSRAGRPNLMIKIPGTPEGWPAIEEAAPTASAPPPPPGWLQRETLTGDWGGARSWLTRYGVTFEPRLTQFYQGISSGASGTSSSRPPPAARCPRTSSVPC